MNDLESGYTAEVDRIGKSFWHYLLPEFDDATFYQTWSYGEKFWGKENISHLVLRCRERVVSIAQLRILRYPLLKTGAAYLNWGPLWRPRGEAVNAAHLRNMLRALRNEYVLRRNLALRILPKIFDTPGTRALNDVFIKERFVQSPDHLRTFIVDLSPSLEEIRQNFHKSWKGSLKFAEKQDLDVFEAVNEDHFGLVAEINREMKSRKQYIAGDAKQLLEVNKDLPENLKLKILLCSHHQDVVAALGWSNIGKVCFPIVGGTGDKALRFKASFLLYWQMIRCVKENGFHFFDTAGVNEKRNPGGYFFKKGLAGKDAREMGYLGQYDAYNSYPTYVVFKTAMSIREAALNGASRLKALLR